MAGIVRALSRRSLRRQCRVLTFSLDLDQFGAIDRHLRQFGRRRLGRHKEACLDPGPGTVGGQRCSGVPRRVLDHLADPQRVQHAHQNRTAAILERTGGRQELELAPDAPAPQARLDQRRAALAQ